MSYTVNASGITKSFGGHVALDHVDLAIDSGSVFALLGPNGAGKTTMIRILATLVRPDSGTATIAGCDLLRDQDGVRGAISLTGQYAAVDDKLTGRENLEMMARLLHLGRKAARTRTAELLAAFDLADAADRRAGTYSGGLKRRLDLAISMIKRPELIFLDEPTTGLDTRSREQVWGTVRDLADDGVTILLTTQYLEEADQLADTIALLDHGQIVARGTADELKSSVGAEVVQLRFGDPGSYDIALAELDPVRSDRRLRLIEVASTGTAAHVHRLLSQLEAAGAPVAKVSTHRPSLDDVFLSLTAPSTELELTR
ncbi:MAG TPA: ATP-binding cassette domain-containing protein [Streptosporangiaceae bacterium]|jgi:ABC-2 type transport system ATP-binding protein